MRGISESQSKPMLKEDEQIQGSWQLKSLHNFYHISPRNLIIVIHVHSTGPIDSHPFPMIPQVCQCVWRLRGFTSRPMPDKNTRRSRVELCLLFSRNWNCDAKKHPLYTFDGESRVAFQFWLNMKNQSSLFEQFQLGIVSLGLCQFRLGKSPYRTNYLYESLEYQKGLVWTQPRLIPFSVHINCVL